MAFSWYEEFLGYDWARFSSLGSQATGVGCLAIGIIGIFFGSSTAESIWSIIAASIIAIWQFPFVYYCVPKCSDFQAFFNERLFGKFEEMKALLCCGLAIPCFLVPSIVILSGILLILTSLLFVFAAINRRADKIDTLLANQHPYEPVPNRTSNPSAPLTSGYPKQYSSAPASSNNPFGTF